MSIPELSSAVAELRRALELIETGLGDDELPPESLEGFKVTIDDVRTRILAMMGGVAPGEYNEHVGRLRIRRAGQLCANIHADLALGTIDANSDQLREFVTVAGSLKSLIQTQS